MVSIYKNSKTETGLLSGLCFFREKAIGGSSYY